MHEGRKGSRCSGASNSGSTNFLLSGLCPQLTHSSDPSRKSSHQSEGFFLRDECVLKISNVNLWQH